MSDKEKEFPTGKPTSEEVEESPERYITVVFPNDESSIASIHSNIANDAQIAIAAAMIGELSSLRLQASFIKQEIEETEKKPKIMVAKGTLRH